MDSHRIIIHEASNIIITAFITRSLLASFERLGNIRHRRLVFLF
jgi:hypothetical protein